jgi:signal transduction histidine kinase
VFIGFFPVMFFTAGGYHGGMPNFFVMAVVFTVIMLEGKRLFAMAALELLVYTSVCVIAYRHPETVHGFAGERQVLVDALTGIILVSILLGITLFKHFSLYRAQQRKLEEAREEALRLSEIKTNFLANMSHEIRSPINVILGMNEGILRNSVLAADNETLPEISRYARNIESAGRMLLGLVNNILDITKIETGRTELNKEPYKTAELIRELAAMGKEEAERKSLTFELKISEGLPSELSGDYGAVKQIAFNFLSNAVKYTERGTVTLKITGDHITGGHLTEDHLSDNQQFILRIAVSDTGIGIKDEDREHLFTAFYRLDQAKRRHIEGTGLGLAISRELADLMNGGITVESAWGKGSVFTAELPQTIEDASPLTMLTEAESDYALNTRASFIAPEGRILVVDDSAANLDVAAALLKGTMLRIDRALSGRECIEKAEQNTYHLILMDYMMSGMDGMETFRELKKRGKGSVPVIALTADAAVGLGQKFTREGFASYLTKTILRRDLEQAILACLPAEVILRRETGTPSSGETGFSKNDNRLFTKLLAPYGIDFNKGLFYLSGDVEQYMQFAEFFIDRYAEGRKEAKDLLARQDWPALKLRIHSLKSRAKNMGAAELHQSAERAERYCAEGKTAFIERALPLLFLQWEEARNGLAAVVEQARTANSALSSAGTMAAAEELLDHVRNMRLTGARKIIRELLDRAEGEQKALLETIQEKIREADYTEAERLLKLFPGSP